ncbi:hypothetical protein PZA11_006034 [Diplocarpon coronariae]
MSPNSILGAAARQCARHQRLTSKPVPATSRMFSPSAIRGYPRKDSQDKESINTEATEYSKSGTDDAAARQEEAAYDPSTTDPQEERKIAGEGNEACGPDVSPANPDVSKQTGQQEGGAEKGVKKEQSGAGRPKKAGKP